MAKQGADSPVVKPKLHAKLFWEGLESDPELVRYLPIKLDSYEDLLTQVERDRQNPVSSPIIHSGRR